MISGNNDNISKPIRGIDKWFLYLFIGAQILHTTLITIIYGANLFPYDKNLPRLSLEGLICGLICLAVLFSVCFKLNYAFPWAWGICMLIVFDLLFYTGCHLWIPRSYLDDLLYGIPYIVQLALAIPALFVLIKRRSAFCINRPILIGLFVAGASIFIFVYFRSEYFPLNEPLWAVEPPFYYKRLTASGLEYPQEKSLALLLLSFVAYYSIYKLAIRRKREEESTIQ